MLKSMIERLRQKYRTSSFPKTEPALPAKFLGCPAVKPELCRQGCTACADVCPTDAVSLDKQSPKLDLGRCLFCGECSKTCATGAISFTRNYHLSARSREDLILEKETMALAKALDEKCQRLFCRSLKLRQVSAGGCNACEADTNVLNTLVFDLGRFGIQFVASPRHADGLLITGPVTQNMELALKKTYEAVPDPKIVIALGSCAISGGLYAGHPETRNGADNIIPVDLYIPGCPPHPYTILDGLLNLLQKKG